MQKKVITTKKSKVCFGITNVSNFGYRLPFFDYDVDMLPDIRLNLIFIQFKYSLSDIYMFKSTNGYNALTLDCIPYNELLKIYKDTNYICNDYVKLGLKRNFLTLRFGTDKKILWILKNNPKKYKKSLSHAMALNLFYNLNIDTPIDEFNDNTIIRFKAYRSEKNGFMKVGEKW